MPRYQMLGTLADGASASLAPTQGRRTASSDPRELHARGKGGARCGDDERQRDCSHQTVDRDPSSRHRLFPVRSATHVPTLRRVQEDSSPRHVRPFLDECQAQDSSGALPRAHLYRARAFASPPLDSESLTRTTIPLPSSNQLTSAMKFNAISALTLAAAFAGVHAQSSSVSSPLPTSTSGLTPCILTCVTQAASANGCQGP